MSISLFPERLPYVRFETRAIQDPEASRREGRYIATDVDFVIIQPAGSKDTIEKSVERWFKSMLKPEQMAHAKAYREMYDAWKAGRELPTHGTPVKTWQALKPAEIENLLHCNVRTVEDVAAMDEATLGRIGMGARALKQKAQAWLDAARDTGKVAAEVEALRASNEQLTKQNAELAAAVEQLSQQVSALTPGKGKRVPKNARLPDDDYEAAV